jgi:tryptophan synthase alpha chain
MIMSRIRQLFEKKTSRILNVYFTAGYPSLDATLEIMSALQENGADLIELGMPYSDPLADGPVIQQSSARALQSGMSIEVLFNQLRNFRSVIHTPVVLMGYMNPVLQYGFEKFCADAASVGIDGLILPDLPPFEFEKIYQPVLKKYELDFIFLVTPETSDERVCKLDALSSGFLYAVSSSSTTGSEKASKAVSGYLERLKSLQLRNPVLVGFGIRDKQTFDDACIHANGVIIGTAYIQAISKTGSIQENTRQFLKQIFNS